MRHTWFAMLLFITIAASDFSQVKAAELPEMCTRPAMLASADPILPQAVRSRPSAGGHSIAQAPSAQSSCSAPAQEGCSSCTVTCPVGQAARCRAGTGFYSPMQQRWVCEKDAVCRCETSQ